MFCLRNKKIILFRGPGQRYLEYNGFRECMSAYFFSFPFNVTFTLFYIIMPLKYCLFGNIMENGAFAPLKQMLHSP